jgi:hypothetical protein
MKKKNLMSQATNPINHPTKELLTELVELSEEDL